MTLRSSEQALRDLEHSQLPPLNLLEQAADILDITLDGLNRRYLVESSDQKLSLPFAPREEWVLRWLLKKLEPADESPYRPNDPRTHFILDKRTWLIFLHLVETIPAESLTRILHEREFFAKFIQKVREILRVQGRETDPLPSRREDDNLLQENEQHPRKKRKLSPTTIGDDTSSVPNTRSRGAAELSLIICRAVCSCTQPIQGSLSTTAARNLPLAQAAKIVSLLLELVLLGLNHYQDGWQATTLSGSIQGILEIWDNSRHLDSGLADPEKNDMYNVQCCKVSLALSSQLGRAAPGTINGVSLQELEYRVSLHTVLPLRAALNKEISSNWPVGNQDLSWSKFEKLYNTAVKHLDGMFNVRFNSEKNENSYPVSTLAPILLDIAVRSIPPLTIRRRQREQPWLEALILALVYLACPSFPRIQGAAEGTLQTVEAEVEGPSPGSLTDVELLLDTIAKHKVKISLPVLSYITSAVLASNISEAQWSCLAKITALDSNVLLPNSGLKNAAPCLDQLCQSIYNTRFDSGPSYYQIRDHIVVPLISGFAQARDLSGFVKIWQAGLKAAFSLAMLTDDEELKVQNGLVWADEQVLAAFCQIARLHAVPSLSRAVLGETLAGLQSRAVLAEDVLASLSILDSLLVCRPQDFTTHSTNLRKLFDCVIAALETMAPLQLQRWRLWSIVRHCLPLLLDSKSPDHPAQLEKLPAKLVSLSATREISAIANGAGKVARFKEIIECFQLLVWFNLNNKDPAEHDDTLQTEITELTNLLTTLSSEGGPPKTDIWDGTLNMLRDKAAVMEACVGILCQYPEVLLKSATNTNALLKGLCEYAKSGYGENTWKTWRTTKMPAQSLVKALLSVDEISSNITVYQHCFKALAESINGKWNPPFIFEVLQRMSLCSVNRSDAQKLADLIETRLQEMKTPTRPEDAIVETALLEKIASTVTVSIGKPHNWKRLVDLADYFGSQTSVYGSKIYQVRARSIQCTLDALWERVLLLEESEKTEKMIAEMIEWCFTLLQMPDDLKCGRMSFIVLRGFINGFWDNRDRPSFIKHGEDLQRLRNSHFRALLADLRWLCADPDYSAGSTPFSLRLIVQSLSRCSDLCEESGELLSLLGPLHAAIESWKNRASKCEADSDLDAKPILERAERRLFKLLPGSSDLSSKRMVLKERYCSIIETIAPKDVGYTMQSISKRIRSVFLEIDDFSPGQCAEILAITNHESEKGSMRYELMAAIVYRTTQIAVHETPELAKHLNTLVSLQCALRAESSEKLCMALECCRLTLERHSGVVNQWAVDGLLSSVTILTSSAASMKASQPGEQNMLTHAIFSRLSDLLGIILARFRRRLQGRYHLLLPAMQNLLRCLYYPGEAAFEAAQSKSHVQMRLVESLPSWAKEAAAPFPPSCATKFARILSSICDPTASSVKSSSRKGSRSTVELTDETKKVKRVAGQYMQYLIVEYSKCSLEGQISPEAKEKLMPGLYAVLDVMPRNLMRAMNAAMDASSRAIFKGLYQDYQRFGKWDNT